MSEHGKKQSMLISIKTSFVVRVRAWSKTINVYICLIIVKPIHVCINIYLNQNQNVYSIVYENLQYIFICLLQLFNVIKHVLSFNTSVVLHLE